MLQVQHLNVNSPRLLGGAWAATWVAIAGDSNKGAVTPRVVGASKVACPHSSREVTRHEKDLPLRPNQTRRKVKGRVNSPTLQVQHLNVNSFNSELLSGACETLGGRNRGAQGVMLSICRDGGAMLKL
jgi:hypothetical protein